MPRQAAARAAARTPGPAAGVPRLMRAPHLGGARCQPRTSAGGARRRRTRAARSARRSRTPVQRSPRGHSARTCGQRRGAGRARRWRVRTCRGIECHGARPVGFGSLGGNQAGRPDRQSEYFRPNLVHPDEPDAPVTPRHRAHASANSARARCAHLAPLDAMAAPAGASRMGCANVAHAFAGMPADERKLRVVAEPGAQPRHGHRLQRHAVGHRPTTRPDQDEARRSGATGPGGRWRAGHVRRRHRRACRAWS